MAASDEKVRLTAQHIVRTLAASKNAADDMIRILSGFDDRFSDLFPSSAGAASGGTTGNDHPATSGEETPVIGRDPMKQQSGSPLKGYAKSSLTTVQEVNDRGDVCEKISVEKRDGISKEDSVKLEMAEKLDDDGSGGSSPEGSVETSISSHFGGMNYPSLFSSRPSGYGVSQSDQRMSGSGSRFGSMDSPVSPAREEPPSYLQRYESFENPMAGHGAQTSGSREDDDSSSNLHFGRALYDFIAGGDVELSLVAGEEVEIDYEVDGWYYVKKKRPGRDGKMAGLVPVLYVSL